jgi:glycosyltransferase involved in cell wall biosynthesis
MKVCMVAYTFYESDNRVMRYSEALAGRGDEVDVICLGREGQPATEALNGVCVVRIQTRSRDEKTKLSYLLRIVQFCLKAVAVVAGKSLRNRYSVVHIHSVPDFLVFAGIGARLLGAKIILDIHDLLPEFYATKFNASSSSVIFRLLRIEERLSASFADHVIAPNHLWREKLVLRAVPASKCTVIMNYPDRKIFDRQGRTRSDSRFVIIYPGSLNPHQGVDIAVKAFASIKDEFPAAEFRIFGEGPALGDIVRLVSELGLNTRVRVQKPLPLRDIAIEIENSDLGVVPKRKDLFGDEAFSTKVFEFMAMGVPVIVSDTRIDRYYFNDEVVTFCEAGNVNDLSDCMSRLIRDRNARERQAEKAKEFMKNYDWVTRQRDYLHIVDSLSRKGHVMSSRVESRTQAQITQGDSPLPEDPRQSRSGQPT